MATQHAFSIANAIISLVNDSQPILYALGILILVLFSWKRAGSAHFLFGRIWRLLGGDKEFTDSYLNTQWKQLRDVESMRFYTGIRFPSKSSATKTLNWMDIHDIALGDLIRAKRFFDPEAVKMKNPHYIMRKTSAGFIMLVLLLLIGLLGTFNQFDEAFLTIKKTRTAFWTNGQVAMSWSRNGWELNKSDCEAGKVVLTPEDNEVICELLKTPPQDFIEQSIQEQRLINAVIISMVILLIAFITKGLISAEIANKLYRKLNA
ncbi:DUF6216 family protein [Pseudomonas sp. X10]